MLNIIHGHDDLKNILTIAEPLGPIAHERFNNDIIHHLVYNQIRLFSEFVIKPHMLFLGRRGAGKSALLSQVRLMANKTGHHSLLYSEDKPHKHRNYILEVTSWQYFHHIVQNVNMLLSQQSGNNIDLIPSEFFVELWYQILWEEIIRHFYNYHAYDDECRRLLGPIDKYVNADGFFEIHPRQQAKTIFNDAKKSVIEFLENKSSKLYFLFDSMERYPLRNPTFIRIIAGLFQGLAKINDESSKIIVSFCIPEEIEPFITYESSNLMKDFASSYRIRWLPIDLIRVIAHRLRISAEIHDKNLYNKIKNLEFSIRDDLHSLFDLVLPKKIINTLGTEEDTLAYIIRHTQLLPRQILAIFNAALSNHYRENNSFMAMKEKSVKQGVALTQKVIAKQILDPYEQIYPKLLAQCRTVLPDISLICDFNSLRRAEKRFDRLIEDDIASVWHVLFEIGILGRSTGKTGSDIHTLIPNDRYCYGQFHFNTDSAFGLATDGEFCFHPVFSRAFGISRRTKDLRVVYPANINLDNIYVED